MNIRYRNNFYSTAGVYWQIDIYDSLYGGLPNNFTTSSGGFNLSYRGITERMDSQMASTLTVPMVITDSTIEAFLIETITSQEERFSVKVYKNGTLDWCGVLLQDQVQQEDIGYPYFVDLTFSDGLGRLKDIDYNDGAATPAKYSGRDTIIDHLFKILGKTGTTQLYSTDAFLQTTVNWYDVRHPYTAANCPFKLTTIDHTNFYGYKEDGTIDYKKTSDVLDQILKLFNARILMAGGHWHVIQAQEYARPTTFSRVFSKTGTLLSSSSTTSFRTTPTVNTRKNGGVTKYYAPLKQVSKIYKTRRSPFDNDSILPLPVPTYSTALIPLISPVGVGDVINFEGTIRTWYQSTGSFITDLWSKFLMRVILTKIADGSKIYLKNVGENYQWTSSNYYIPIQVGPYGVTGFGAEFNEEYPLTFTLPTLSYEYTAEFQIYLDGLFTGPGFPYTLQAGESYNHWFIDFKMIVDGAKSDITFKAVNTLPGGAAVNSTLEIKGADTYLGDGPSVRSLGRLQASNGTTYADSSAWGVHNSISRANINQLSVNQNLSGQRVPTEKFSGTFISTTINALSSLVWGARVFVPIVLTLNPVNDEIQGEWFNVIIPVL